MIKNLFNRINLQLFGGEGGTGGDGGSGTGNAASGAGNAATVGTAGDDGQVMQDMQDLKVPEDVMQKYGKALKRTYKQKAPTKSEAMQGAEEPTGQQETAPATEEAPSMTWDQFMAIPENNEKMQGIVKSRLRSSKDAEETLGKLAPVLEYIGNRYNIAPDDYDGMVKAVNEDGDYWEDLAVEMGTDVDTAHEIAQLRRKDRVQTATIQQMMLNEHFDKMYKQAEELKKTFPDFNLAAELNDPETGATFRNLTRPGGISVSQAYNALHGEEIRAAAIQMAAQKSAQRVSNSVQANSHRPTESGTTGVASSSTTINPAKLSKEQYRDLIDRIQHGEMISFD